MEIEIVKFFQSMQSPFWDTFFSICTMLGEEAFIIVVLLIAYYAVNKDFGEYLFYGILTSLMLNTTIKNIVRRDRPFQVDDSIVNKRPETSNGFSFPSGHMQGSSSLFGGIYIYSKKKWLLIVGIVAVVLVGVSRMYIGVHFLTDVLCGLLFAVISMVGCKILKDKFSDKKYLLYLVTALAFLPMVFFAETDDFFKNYGLFIGFILSVVIENRYIKLEMAVKWWQKLLRIVIAIILVLAAKEGLKLILPGGMFFAFLRYAVVSVFGMAVSSFVFKAIKI